jgi:hypothetical protein
MVICFVFIVYCFKYETTSTVGTITASRDVYRIAHTVTSDSALAGAISKSFYKVINLSTYFDLLNLTSESSNTALKTKIDNAIADLKAKFSDIPATQQPEFAVVKLNPSDLSKTIGIDLLRNIERLDMRNWFDTDGNTRPTGAEVATTGQNSLVLKSEDTLYLSADQTFYTLKYVNTGN